MTHPRSMRRLALAALAALALASAAMPWAQAAAKRRQFIGVLRVTPHYQDPAAWTEQHVAVIAKHFERLSQVAAQGRLLMAGRTTEPLPQTFGVVIFEADSLAAATQFMHDDPAVVAGLMSATVHPYAVALQRPPKVQLE